MPRNTQTTYLFLAAAVIAVFSLMYLHSCSSGTSQHPVVTTNPTNTATGSSNSVGGTTSTTTGGTTTGSTTTGGTTTGGTTTGGTTTGGTTTISYAQSIAPLLQSKCAGCHPPSYNWAKSSASSPNFTSGHNGQTWTTTEAATIASWVTGGEKP